MDWSIDCREISTHVEVDRRTSLCFQSRRYPGHACRVSVCLREKKVNVDESVICFYFSVSLSLRSRGRGGSSPFLLLRPMVKARGRWRSSPCTTSPPRRTLISRSNRCRRRRTNIHTRKQSSALCVWWHSVLCPQGEEYTILHKQDQLWWRAQDKHG